MGLVGGAHSISHFFQLAVPVAFPLIKKELDLSYAELGLLATLFYVSSGLCQPASGFLVDHFGARRLLFSGIGLLSGAVLLCGLAPGYPILVVLMMLAGAGNSVFHPADYAILNASIKESQLGRAYGVHTLGGNLGWAIAPMTVFSLGGTLGWRPALVIVGMLGLIALGLLMSQAALLDDGIADRRKHGHAHAPPGLRAIFLSPAILFCFAYFVLLAIATIGVQNFMPAILFILHGLPLTTGSGALTVFLFGSSAGTIVGALLADRTGSHYQIVAGGLAFAAILIAAVGYISGPELVTTALACAGLCLGTTLPSRDMVVRQATPRGASGRVFGFVYSGLDAGSAIAPVTIGVLLDRGEAGLAVWFLASALVLAIGTTVVIQRLGN
jgi:FSR family fosmidomycin resistance protein-like MFS transporter